MDYHIPIFILDTDRAKKSRMSLILDTSFGTYILILISKIDYSVEWTKHQNPTVLSGLKDWPTIYNRLFL